MSGDSERLIPPALMATADMPRAERPVAASSRPDVVEEHDPRCVGCHGIHGSVHARINCMAREIARLRAILACARECACRSTEEQAG